MESDAALIVRLHGQLMRFSNMGFVGQHGIMVSTSDMSRLLAIAARAEKPHDTLNPTLPGGKDG